MAKVASQMRFDETLYKKTKYIANEEYRSVNGQIEYFMALGVKQYEEIHGEIDVIDLANLDQDQE